MVSFLENKISLTLAQQRSVGCAKGESAMFCYTTILKSCRRNIFSQQGERGKGANGIGNKKS
ncbi:MAG: hypothetical protein ACJAYN_002442 [Bermanella sp.]|jgi:hypothetical protein|nr:hypothetical protein CXF81_15250 [Glaciecola sp. 33A]